MAKMISTPELSATQAKGFPLNVQLICPVYFQLSPNLLDGVEGQSIIFNVPADSFHRR